MSIRTAAWLAWSLCGFSLALTALSLLLLALNLSHLNVRVFGFNQSDYWAEYTIAAVAGSTVGAIIASRRPENPIGWILCSSGLIAGVEHFAAEYAAYALLAEPGALPGGEVLAWVSFWIWTLPVSFFVFLCLLFPDGRLPSSRWRWFAWFSAAVTLIGAVSIAFDPGPIDGLGLIQNPLGVEGFNVAKGVRNDFLVQTLLGALGLVATASLFMRLRRAKGDEREQLKWFAYAATVLASGIVLTYTVSYLTGVPWFYWVGFVLVLAGVAGIAVAMGIAILKYRLYDIDLIINRTLVYGALSASVLGIYVLVVGGLGSLMHVQGNFLISLLATGLVAVLFQPLRNRLQRGVNQLLYGERDEPYAVLSRLGQRLEATLAPEAALKTIVETVAQALKLPYAAIALKQSDGGLAMAAEYGSPVRDPVVLPLVYRRQSVGQLVLAPRSPGETFSPSDRRLLGDLARHAGVAVHAVRLTADLQRSREHLVTAREEERRRLRRDLHDGLGPQLASLTMIAEAARDLVPNDPGRAQEMMEGLAEQAQGAVADVRRLVYALRPPALDALGVMGALRSQATHQDHNGLRITIDGPEELPALPAAVEVAAYRIVLEALTNVVHHAEARNCTVRLTLDEEPDMVTLEVADDGRGIEEDRGAGVGLTSMRERAEELGGSCMVEAVPSGGTRVRALLPYVRDDMVGNEVRRPDLKETWKCSPPAYS